MVGIPMPEEAPFHKRSKHQCEVLGSELLETAGVHSGAWILISRLAGVCLSAQSWSQLACLAKPWDVR